MQDLTPLILPDYGGIIEVESPRVCRKCGLHLPVGAFYCRLHPSRPSPRKQCKHCCRNRQNINNQARVGTTDYIAYRMYAGAKRRADHQNVSFALTREWFLEKIQAGACELTGVPFYIGPHSRHPRLPSPDRIRPDEGYEPHNTRMILWMVNAAKGSSGEELFMECLKQVAEAILRAS